VLDLVLRWARRDAGGAGFAGLIVAAWPGLPAAGCLPGSAAVLAVGARRAPSDGSGSVLVRAVMAAPDLDGWAIVERLLKDLAPLADRLWLVLDDVHELGSAEARRQSTG
jgi:hypothetical protein